MKRYRVVNMHFDTTANVLGMLDPKIQDDWPQATKDLAIRNRDQLRAGLVASYGNGHFEAKLANLKDIGMLPFSVIAFHNDFLEQARHAFVMGLYYPALTATCVLGERVLNHLMLMLRDDHRETSEYAKVAKKESFDNWHVSVEVLSAWGVLLPPVVAAFKKLERLRHQAIHFDPSIDTDPRSPALTAIRLFQEIVQGQFSTYGDLPWYMTIMPGAVTFVRKSFESWPFVKRVIVPNCRLVGPDHEVLPTTQGQLFIRDHSPDGPDVADDEFIRLYQEANDRRVAAIGQ